MVFIHVITGPSGFHLSPQQSVHSSVARVILLKCESDHISSLLWPSSSFLTYQACKPKSPKTFGALTDLLLHLLTLQTSPPSIPPSLCSSHQSPCLLWTTRRAPASGLLHLSVPFLEPSSLRCLLPRYTNVFFPTVTFHWDLLLPIPLNIIHHSISCSSFSLTILFSIILITF